MYLFKIESIKRQKIDVLKKLVSKERVEKAMRMRHDEDKLRSLLVEKILNDLLLENNLISETPVELEYDKYGKPSVKNHGNINISLSHAGDYVACMVADAPCGIDIEKIDRNYKKILTRVFTQEELEAGDSDMFYATLWTLKEAVVKAMGTGITQDFREFTVLGNEIEVKGVKYKIESLEAPFGYTMSFAIKG